MAFRDVIASANGSHLKLVLSGSDMGNKDYILSVVRNANLENHVHVLGFISNEEVYTFYKNALTLVMPTFLGPTNMPLLEAQALGTAVICSDLEGHRELCKDSAIYADPACPDQWTEAILSLLKPDLRTDLINKANRNQATSPFTIQHALDAVEKSLIKFSAIRKTFP
jgi:glycosyltransferase involved in cell wall biosynthesis